MTDYSVVIDIILNGLAQIDDLADGVKRLKSAARESERAAQSLTRVDDATQDTIKSQRTLSDTLSKSEQQIARYAIANARLKQAQGDVAGATKELQGALSQLQTGGLAALRVQTALVNVQNNYANSPLIGAIRGQGQAFGTLADQAQAAQTQLRQAQAQAEQTGQAFDSGTHSIDRQRDALGRFVSGTATVEGSVEKLADSVDKLAENTQQQPAGEGFIHGLLRDLNGVTVVITTVIALFDLFERATKHTDASSDIVSRVAKGIVQGFGGAKTEAAVFEGAVKKVEETIHDLGQAADQVFGRVVNSQKQASTATRAAGQDLLSYIAKVNAEMRAANAQADVEERITRAKQRQSDARADLFRQMRAANQKVREDTAILEGAEKRYADAIRLTVQRAAEGTVQVTAFQRAKKVIIDFLKDESGTFSTEKFLNAIARDADRAAVHIRPALAKIQAAFRTAIDPQTQNRFQAFFNSLTGGEPILKKLGDSFSALKGQGAAALQSLGGEAALTTAAIGGLTVAVGLLVAGLITLAAVATAGAVAVGILGATGVKSNAQLEQVHLGIATIIASVGVLRNDKGIELKGIDALNAALPLAKDQLEKLRVEALQTALDFSQIAPAFLQAIGPGLAAGLQLDQIRKTVIDISQIIIPLTGDAGQLAQELRSIFTGDIGPDSGVAKALGITKEMVEKAKEQNKLADLLNEKLKIAAATGKLMGQTFAAATSNLREAGSVFAEKVTEGFFNRLKAKINEKLPQIFDTSQGTVEIAAKFRGLADTFTGIFDRLGVIADDVFDEIFSLLERFSAFLEQNRDDVNLFLDTLELAARAAADLGETIALAFGTNAAGTLRFIINQVADFIRLVGILKDLWELVGAAGALAINTIIGAIYEAADALKFLGIHIDGAAEGLARAEARAARLRDRLNEGFVNARRLDEELNRLQNQSKLVTDFGNAVLVGPDGKPIGNAGVVRDKFSTLKPLPSVGGRTTPKDADKGKRAAERNVRDSGDAEIRAEDQVRRALSALKQAYAERDEAAARNSLKRESALLDEALEDRRISLTDYFDAKDALVKQSNNLEIAALKRQMDFARESFAEIDASQQRQIEQAQKENAVDVARAKSAKERKALAEKLAQELKVISDKSETERIETDKKLIALQKELDAAEAHGATEAANNARKRIAAHRELLQSISEAGSELKRLTGQELQAQLEDIDRRFSELLAKVKLEFREGSQEVKLLLELIGKLKANARLDEDIRQARLSRSVTDAERELAEVQIQNRVVAGLLTERQARREILAIQRAYAAQVLPFLNAEIAALKARGAEYRDQVIQLEAQREALKQLSIDTEAANRRVAKSLEEGLRNAIEGIGDQIKTLRDFAKAVVDSVLAEFKRLLADEVVDTLFGGKTDRQTGETKQGPIPSLIDKIFGIFGKKKEGETGAAGVIGAVTGIGGGAGNQLQATNQNTQATVQNTQALVGMITTLGGQAPALGGGGGGGILGTILGGIGSLFGGGGDAGGGGGALGGFITQGEFGTQPGAGQIGAADIGGGEGGGLGSILSPITGILGSFLGGGAGGAGATNLLDGVNLLIQALNKNTQALQQGGSGGGGGGIAQLAELFAGGFAEGGFTFGSVGKAAGVVHGGEYVFSAPAVNNLGLGWLESVHQSAKHGYEAGGFVDPHRDRMLPVGSSAPAAQQAPVVNIRPVNVFSEDDVAAAMTSPAAEIAFLNFASRRAPELRARLKIKG